MGALNERQTAAGEHSRYDELNLWHVFCWSAEALFCGEVRVAAKVSDCSTAGHGFQRAANPFVLLSVPICRPYDYLKGQRRSVKKYIIKTLMQLGVLSCSAQLPPGSCGAPLFFLARFFGGSSPRAVFQFMLFFRAIQGPPSAHEAAERSRLSWNPRPSADAVSRRYSYLGSGHVLFLLLFWTRPCAAQSKTFFSTAPASAWEVFWIYYQRKFRNQTSDYTESCCWRSVNQEMRLRRCDRAGMWDMRIWRDNQKTLQHTSVDNQNIWRPNRLNLKSVHN